MAGWRVGGLAGWRVGGEHGRCARSATPPTRRWARDRGKLGGLGVPVVPGLTVHGGRLIVQRRQAGWNRPRRCSDGCLTQVRDDRERPPRSPRRVRSGHSILAAGYPSALGFDESIPWVDDHPRWPTAKTLFDRKAPFAGRSPQTPQPRPRRRAGLPTSLRHQRPMAAPTFSSGVWDIKSPPMGGRLYCPTRPIGELVAMGPDATG